MHSRDAHQVICYINTLDFKVFSNLQKIGETKVDELSQQMKKEKIIAIHRQLYKLMNKTLKTFTPFMFDFYFVNLYFFFFLITMLVPFLVYI